MGNNGEKKHVPVSVNHFNVVGSGEIKMGDKVIKKKEHEIKSAWLASLEAWTPDFCVGFLQV